MIYLRGKPDPECFIRAVTCKPSPAEEFVVTLPRATLMQATDPGKELTRQSVPRDPPQSSAVMLPSPWLQRNQRRRSKMPPDPRGRTQRPVSATSFLTMTTVGSRGNLVARPRSSPLRGRRECSRLSVDDEAIERLEEELVECTNRCRRFMVSEPPTGFDPASDNAAKFDECEFGDDLREAMRLGLLTTDETDELLRELKLQRHGAEAKARQVIYAVGLLHSLPPAPPPTAPADMQPQNCSTETEDIIARLIELNADETKKDSRMVSVCFSCLCTQKSSVLG
eukprot:SAG31_NODE_654_length_13128_cov_10.472408_9_plen_282_part_00